MSFLDSLELATWSPHRLTSHIEQSIFQVTVKQNGLVFFVSNFTRNLTWAFRPIGELYPTYYS